MNAVVKLGGAKAGLSRYTSKVILSAAALAATTSMAGAALNIKFVSADDGTASRTLTAADLGTTIGVDVYATVTGTDASLQNEWFQSIQLNILSSGPSTLAVSASVSPTVSDGSSQPGYLTVKTGPYYGASKNFQGQGYSTGQLVDLNGDGNPDIGGVNGDDTVAHYFYPRGGSLYQTRQGTTSFTTIPSFYLGTIYYDVNSLHNGTDTVTGMTHRDVNGNVVASSGTWALDSTTGTTGGQNPSTDSVSFTPFTLTYAAAVTGPSISLTAGAPTGEGSQITNGTSTPTGANQINVAKVGGAYNPGFLNGFTSNTSGYATVGGFTAGDVEVYGLKVTVPSGGSLSTLAADINANGGTVFTSSSVPSQYQGAVNSLEAGPSGNIYNLFVAYSGAGALASGDIGFNLVDNSLNYTVTDLAAVPEPGSIAVIGLAASSLLISRRRRRA